MKLRALLVTVLALLLLSLGVAWWRSHERREEWVGLPRTGEAARNPLYALKLALGNDGVRVQSRRRLQLDQFALGPRDTVLVYGDPRAVNAADAGALLRWVASGGHLILRTPPSGWVGSGGISIKPARSPARLESRPPTSLTALFTPLDSPPKCEPVRVAGESRHVEFCQGRRFRLTATPDRSTRIVWGLANDGLVYARSVIGRGSVDILADLDFLTTDKLRDGPHIALTRQLLAPNYRAGTVHLVYDAQLPSLWLTLLRHGWMAWLPLLLMLVAWLWQRMQRFGPLLPAPTGERRSLLEHIVASGEHTYRYGYGHLLHTAVRTAFLTRLRRRDPIAAALEGESQVALLAQRFKLAPADIRTTLATPTARDHAAFRARIATLIRLRNQL